MEALQDIEAIGYNQPEPTLMENIKNLNFKGILSNIEAYHFNWMHMGLFGAIGFFAGLLCKKYLKMFLVSFVVGVALILVLEYSFHIISWETVNTMLGNDPAQVVNGCVQNILAYAKQNVSLVVVGIIGFFVGYQVG